MLGQALDQALGDRRGSRATAMRSCRWTRRAPRAHRPLRAAVLPLRRRPAAGATGDFDHELAEEFFRAVSNSARMTLHVTSSRAPTPTT